MFRTTRMFLLAVVAAGFVSMGSAQGPDDRRGCVNSSLNGPYAFTANGVVLASSGLPAALVGPFASFGTATYDGSGNVVLSASANFNGAPQTLNSVKGTYLVNGDCTFTSRLENGVTFYAVITGNGDELLVLQTTPGTIITGTARRVTARRLEISFEGGRRCDVSSVSRAYGFILTGSGRPPYVPANEAGPQAAVGTATFDVRGTFTINSLNNANGAIEAQPQQIMGTYTVASNCTINMKAYIGLNFTGLVLNGGSEIQVIETDPGATILVRNRSIR